MGPNLTTSRIEALSDGVFAIAMTLLVLKLEVPTVMHHTTNARMLQQLLTMSSAFVAYVVTFMVAGGFWYRRGDAGFALKTLEAL